jgi:Ca-activated chloride channel family protein
MKAAARLAVCALLLLPLYSLQRQPYSLSVDVDLIVLNVRVLDKNRQSVHGLSKENFVVEDDGKRQDISLFIGQESPATIGLVLDSSASMNSRHSDVRAAALRFIQSSHPRDQIFVMYFNERLHWPLPQNQPFTGDINVLERALAWNGLGGRTALYDALAAGLGHSGRGEWEKRALIVLTDGGDNASSKTLPQVLRFAQESNVTIYTIGLFDALAVGSSQPVLRKLAALTGGDAYLPHTIDQLAPVWDEISHGIRTQYTIGYRPSQTVFDGKLHKLRVRVKPPDHAKVTVHTRPGYLARKATPEP